MPTGQPSVVRDFGDEPAPASSLGDGLSPRNNASTTADASATIDALVAGLSSRVTVTRALWEEATNRGALAWRNAALTAVGDAIDGYHQHNGDAASLHRLWRAFNSWDSSDGGSGRERAMIDSLSSEIKSAGVDSAQYVLLTKAEWLSGTDLGITSTRSDSLKAVD